MAKDKAKDDELFNYSQDSEHEYVIRQYPHEHRPYVKKFLKTASGTLLNRSTHKEVYELIEHYLGLARPHYTQL